MNAVPFPVDFDLRKSGILIFSRPIGRHILDCSRLSSIFSGLPFRHPSTEFDLA